MLPDGLETSGRHGDSMTESAQWGRFNEKHFKDFDLK